MSNSKLSGFKWFDFLGIPVAAIAIAISTVNLIYGNESYVSKYPIKMELFTVIDNGGDLRALKNVYGNREKGSWKFRGIFLKDEDGLYEYSVPMSKILEDIRSDYYLKVKIEGVGGGPYGYLDKADEAALKKINEMIKENEETNPFEGLEAAQKDNFENIRIKLSDNYALVAGDMEKLSSDLRSKNDLVGQYLRDSTVSFWVSVIALIFSLVISAYQIYMSRDSRLRVLISSAVNETKD